MKTLLASVAVAAILVSSAAFAQAPADPAPMETKKEVSSDTSTAKSAVTPKKHKATKGKHKKAKKTAAAPAPAAAQ